MLTIPNWLSHSRTCFSTPSSYRSTSTPVKWKSMLPTQNIPLAARITLQNLMSWNLYPLQMRLRYRIPVPKILRWNRDTWSKSISRRMNPSQTLLNYQTKARQLKSLSRKHHFIQKVSKKKKKSSIFPKRSNQRLK